MGTDRDPTPAPAGEMETARGTNEGREIPRGHGPPWRCDAESARPWTKSPSGPAERTVDHTLQANTLDERTPSHQSLFEFVSTRRFTIVRRVGAGGMGVVYEARDNDRNETVALKTLLGVDAGSLYRFKREFRALADVVHPHLVALHELFSEGDRIFFTMEFVRGGTFLEYAWGGTGSSEDLRLDLQRLRAALRQLADGLHALHRASRLHRDIKPSNVLVDRDGRVVLVDFGLVGEVGPDLETTADGGVVGTPAYMAPEQAAGEDVTPASDWYSVGVMLYQALTGQLPFRGKGVAVMLAKQDTEPPPPSQLQSDIPADLDGLCVELLRRDPARRPSGREILRKLAGSGAALQADASSSAESGPFIGREAQLDVLRDAYEQSRTGEPVLLYVHGYSGMGKTALVRHFLRELRLGERAVALGGRCYERESVPYKALDSLIDALCRWLLRVADDQVAALLPRNVAALARLFPVLSRVPAISHAPQRIVDGVEPQELRRRAFSALKELLARIADRHPLVLHVDDVQWGDADSAELLVDLLRPPEAPAVLLICSYRTEEASRSPTIRALPRPGKRSDLLADVREVVVQPLEPDDAEELALSLLPTELTDAHKRAKLIARESEGSPFFVGELARQAATGGDPSTLRLETVLAARLGHLGDDARRLLETVAVAAGPIAQDVAVAAAGMQGSQRVAIAALRSGHFVRTRGPAPEDPIEIYHGRIGEAVVGALDHEALADRHRALADALEASGRADPELLAAHYRHGGRWRDAGEYAAVAAEQAANALAFDRAARLYRLALDLLPTSDSRRFGLMVALGEALTHGGRPIDGARVYLEAAPNADTLTSLELRRRAADQLLRSGEVDEGLQLTRDVLATVGMRLPSGSTATLASFLAASTRLRFRSFRFHERSEADVQPEELRRIDVCASLASGLAGVDLLLAWDFQTRQTLHALRAGEPSRVARALAMQAVFASLAGGMGNRQASRILGEAESLAERVSNPHALGLAAFARGMMNLWQGRFQESRRGFDRAITVFRDRCEGVPWHLGVAELFSIIVLSYLGDIGEMARRHAILLREFRERDDRYTWVGLQTGRVSFVWLAHDDPDGVRAACDDALAHWSQRGYQAQHWWGLVARTHADLYEGRGPEARERLDREWPMLERANLLRVQLLRIEARFLRAATAIVCARSDRDGRERWLAVAERDLRAIEKERMPFATAQAHLFRAGIAHARGDQDATVRDLSRSSRQLDNTEQHTLAAVADGLRGRIIGGTAGDQLVREFDAVIAANRIRKPTRFIGMLAPGFGSPP